MEDDAAGGEKAAEKTVKGQKSRESKLTVRPIRFQLEQPKHRVSKKTHRDPGQ